MLDRRVRKFLGARVVRPVNDQRFADNILARHESPIAAVERLVAVIAHSEKIARRHHDFAVLHIFFEHHLRRRINRRIRICRREIVAIRIDVIELVNNIRLVQQMPVQKNLLVLEVDSVAGHAHDPLHEGLLDIDRITENDDVAAVNVLIGQQMAVTAPPGANASLSTSR